MCARTDRALHRRPKARLLTADCIIGHHPHVIHPAKWQNGKLVAYSLGNLTCIPSICQNPDGAAHSILLSLTLVSDESGTRLEGSDFKVIETVEGVEKVPFCRVCEDESYARLLTRSDGTEKLKQIKVTSNNT